MKKSTYYFIFAFFLIWGCSSQTQDTKLYNEGKEAYQVYTQTLDEDSLYQTYQCFRQIKGKRYQKKISKMLLGFYASYGDYDEGREYRKSLDGIVTKDKHLNYLLIVFPDFYDLMEAADNDDKERVNNIAWTIIKNTRENQSLLGQDNAKFEILAFISLLAPDSIFFTDLDNAFDSGNDIIFYDVLDKYNGFEFDTISLLEFYSPYRTYRMTLHP